MKDHSEYITITDEDGSKKTVRAIHIEDLMNTLEDRIIKNIKEDTSFDEEK